MKRVINLLFLSFCSSRKSKRSLFVILAGYILFSGVSCTEEEKYDYSVVRQVDLFLDGKEWALNTGISTKPFLIYHADNGDYFANYSSHYRFSLKNGEYLFVATPMPANLVPDSAIATNLNDLYIRQSPNADQAVQISRAAEYNSPFSEVLALNMVTRTGTLRLKALDTTADNSYSSVRAIVVAQRSAYRVSNETYVESPIEIVRAKTTATGGVNYTDDFVLFQTKDARSGIQLRFELLDATGAVVREVSIDGTFEIFPKGVAQVDFYLNETPAP